MRVLVWTIPWAGQGGDLFFGKAAFARILLAEAKILAARGWEVFIACPDAYLDIVREEIPNDMRCSIFFLDATEAIQIIGGWFDPSAVLYTGEDSPLCKRIAHWLRPQLPQEIDCILSWETPLPYLRQCYPDALVIHQMPGVFARSPYPETIVFDPLGLYRHGALYRFAGQILNQEREIQNAEAFTATAKKLFSLLPYGSRWEYLTEGDTHLAILPLQVSEHYAFCSDTGCTSQVGYCEQVMRNNENKTRVVATVYKSGYYKNQDLSERDICYLKKKYPFLTVESNSHNLVSITQHMFPYADRLITATSSLAMQALLWNVPLRIVGNTCWKPYEGYTVPQAQKVLSFILEQHQPLLTKILGDKNFLVHLIEDLYSKKEKQGLEKFSSFASIDKKYIQELIQSFSYSKIQKVFLLKGILKDTSIIENKFNSLIQTISPVCISFDLFDTLVVRKLESPVDVFQYVEEKALERGISVPYDFAMQRQYAEAQARANSAFEEITLDEIYAEFVRLGVFDQSQAEIFRDLEMESEVELSAVRAKGLQLFSLAREAELPIYITTDMYLPRSCIESILEKHNYLKNTKGIFLSSELRQTKRSGNLFAHIISTLQTPGEKILHVGDNEKTDIRSARRAGMSTFHLRKNADSFKDNAHLHPYLRRGPFTSLSRSVCAAAIANRYYDCPGPTALKSIASNNARQFGYCLLGPFIFGLVSWIRQRALKDSIDALFFLSREGKILKDVFDRLNQTRPIPVESHYLWISRRVVRLATLRDRKDLLYLSRLSFDAHATVGGILQGRFGFSPDESDCEALKHAGYMQWDDKLERSSAGSLKFDILLTLLEEKILALAEQKRHSYLAYLAHKRLAQGNNAVVDIGWNGNLQGSLGNLLGRPLTGYYFATLKDSLKWIRQGHAIHAYYAENSTYEQDDVMISERKMLEHLLCDTAPSLLYVKQNFDDSFTPVYADAPDESQNETLREMHAGALDFTDEACRTLGSLCDRIPFTPDVSVALLKSFLTHPTPRDASLLIGHRIDDAFSAAPFRYLLAPPQTNKPSLWKQGEQCLKRKKATPTPPKSFSLRSRIVLGFCSPFFVPHLRQKQRTMLESDPRALFAGVRHPVMRLIGRVSGLR